MSENREKLLKDIQEQGDLVRKLKAAKESAEKVGDSEKKKKSFWNCNSIAKKWSEFTDVNAREKKDWGYKRTHCKHTRRKNCHMPSTSIMLSSLICFLRITKCYALLPLQTIVSTHSH